jgi:hypothetical protein
MRFMYAGSGEINLDAIESLESLRGGKTRIRLRSGEVVEVDGHIDPWREVVQIIPVQGEWECLIAGFEPGSGEWFCVAEPIIAWGFTAKGSVVPVTPMDTGATLEDGYGVRRVGTKEIHVAETRTFADENQWRRYLEAIEADRARREKTA